MYLLYWNLDYVESKPLFGFEDHQDTNISHGWIYTLKAHIWVSIYHPLESLYNNFPVQEKSYIIVALYLEAK